MQGEMQVQRPTLFQVAMADVRIYQFFSVLALLGSLGILLTFFSRFLEPGIVALIGAAIAGGLLFRRVRLMRHLLAQAVEATGQITSIRRPLLVSRSRSRYRVKYRYTFQEQEYDNTCLISTYTRQMEIEPGDAVTVLLDPEHPQHALLPALYLDSPQW
jgi:uncharacterized integral membrane protein